MFYSVLEDYTISKMTTLATIFMAESPVFVMQARYVWVPILGKYQLWYLTTSSAVLSRLTFAFAFVTLDRLSGPNELGGWITRRSRHGAGRRCLRKNVDGQQR